MRSTYVLAIGAMLAAAPAVGQVIYHSDPEIARHEYRAARERAEARWTHQEAQRRAAMGDYAGAARLEREARRDWRDARRAERRAAQESEAHYHYSR